MSTARPNDELRIAIEGSISDLTPRDEERLFGRGRAADPQVERAVAAIVADVRARGDEALRELALRFEGVELESLEVPRAAWDAALQSLDAPIRSALEEAAGAITVVHRAQLPQALDIEVRAGVRIGRRAEPLRRVGVYAPGGEASYPSSVLMGVIPARVAGVDEVIVCSPPARDGHPPAAVLAACALARADRVFTLGGAGAVAALAFGTASVPRVDKVVGPGNVYVNEAKRQLTGAAAIDTPAGPSEVLVIADGAADPELAAAELLAQAEHDPTAAAVLVATDETILSAARAVLSRLASKQRRRDIVESALAANGALLEAADLDEALAFAARYAPEHLVLLVRDPRQALERVRAAGTVLLGRGSSVVFGDYLTGANHVLPTGGMARAYSGLSTLDFLRWFTYQEISDDAAAALAGPTATLAQAEGLSAHAAAARLRSRGAMSAVPSREAGATALPRLGPRNESGRDAVASSEEEEELRDPVASSEKHEARHDPVASSEKRKGRHDPAPSSEEEVRLPRATSFQEQARRDPLAWCEDAPASYAPLRRTYAGLELYEPDCGPAAVDLSDNTSLFGPGPAAAQALSRLDPAALTRYPTVYADRLKEALAHTLGIAPDNIATGCGSDDVIDSAIRAFCEPGDVVVYAEPTFSMVPTFARMNGAHPVAVPLGHDFALEPDALLRPNAHITYLCRPNNPTGTVFERAAVEQVVRGAAGAVLVDEAYADFAEDTLLDLALLADRLIVVRTLSKAYGLAGLRIGFAVGPAALIREVEKSRGPYKVGAAAEIAATAALREDGPWVRANVASVRHNRTRLAVALQGLGLRTWPSSTNFLLVQLPEQRAGAAHDFAAALRVRGVGVRPFAALPQAGECIRVSVGPWAMMERFLEAAKQELENG